MGCRFTFKLPLTYFIEVLEPGAFLSWKTVQNWGAWLKKKAVCVEKRINALKNLTCSEHRTGGMWSISAKFKYGGILLEKARHKREEEKKKRKRIWKGLHIYHQMCLFQSMWKKASRRVQHSRLGVDCMHKPVPRALNSAVVRDSEVWNRANLEKEELCQQQHQNLETNTALFKGD